MLFPIRRSQPSLVEGATSDVALFRAAAVAFHGAASLGSTQLASGVPVGA
jgi:hypothetical protein